MDAGDSSQDGTLYGLASSVTNFAETYTRRRFVRQGWSLLTDFFPGYVDQKLVGQNFASPFVSGSNAVLVGIRYAIVLPFPPVHSIDLFQYSNANGDTTAMVSGTDYIQDLDSQPCRLTPPFGAMWPVARVIANAIRIDYTLGYATPIALSTTANQVALGNTSPPSYLFTAADVGRPISIPGAGTAGGTLNTVIASVSNGAASMRDAAGTNTSGATALLVAHGAPGHWELIKTSIKFGVNELFLNRLAPASIFGAMRTLLGPVRDLRV